MSFDFSTLTLASFFIIVLRYFAVAGSVYWFVYVRNRERFVSRKLQLATAPARIVKREILWSLVTSLIFAIAGAASWMAWQSGYTRIYLDVSEYHWTYLIISFVVMAFLHDTYFYWIHRLMHHPALFKTFHRVHHESQTPTPWAAFSFHPLEAVLEALILPLLLFVVPVHPATFLALLTMMTVLSVINHLGYEFYPAGFRNHPWGSYLISATHHDTHHRQYRYNYGLYFSAWDRWMGTESPIAGGTAPPEFRGNHR